MTLSASVPSVIFEDQHLIVVSKPAGMLSQQDISGVPSLVDWLREYVGRNYIGLLHRLDRNTSGLLVAAKRSKAAARMTSSIQKGDVKRKYRGWMSGTLSKNETWEDTLAKDEKKNLVRVDEDPDFTFGKDAVTHVKPVMAGVWKGKDVTLAEFELETGRSHQIRVQCAAHGYPLIGDTKYGKFSKESPEGSFGRPALHAFSLEFPHPMSGEVKRFEIDLPEDFKRVEVKKISERK